MSGASALGGAGDEVAVISPHLDDAVFSLGAAIAASAEAGASVRVVTAFGCDPDSDAPAGDWDARAGFRTEGEAARVRRSEDLRACAAVGAEPVWLPYPDASYGRATADDDLYAALAGAVAGADAVLVPGYPLRHPDHARLARLLLERGLDAGRLGLYAEQPYALRAGGRSRLGDPIRGVVHGEPGWRTLPIAARHRRRKRAACRAYASQLPLFVRVPAGRSAFAVWRIALADRGREPVAWLNGTGTVPSAAGLPPVVAR